MLELEELDKEYQRLNTELNETGPNEQTIEAMVSNLQLRLDLLRRLKIKLNEIKNLKLLVMKTLRLNFIIIVLLLSGATSFSQSKN